MENPHYWLDHQTMPVLLHLGKPNEHLDLMKSQTNCTSVGLPIGASDRCKNGEHRQEMMPDTPQERLPLGTCTQVGGPLSASLLYCSKKVEPWRGIALPV